MSDNMDDGGPAFPTKGPPHKVTTAYGEHYEDDNHGMSLRDWFAGQALLATAGYRESADIPDIAKQAYAIADAMLAARKAKP